MSGRPNIPYFTGKLDPDPSPMKNDASPPPVALTDEERDQVESARYHAEKCPSEWWSESILELTDIIDRLLALRPAPLPQGWRTMESAPKDGTRVLLARFTGDPKDEMDGHAAVDRWRTWQENCGYSGWGKFNAEYWPPTHWMSLPSPPHLPEEVP